MLTLPHALTQAGPVLRAEVHGFLQAVERARHFGFLTELAGSDTLAASGLQTSVGAQWACGEVGLSVTGLPHAFAAEDLALVRRGVLHLLALHGDESALERAAALATPATRVEDAAIRRGLPAVSGGASIDCRKSFHLHLLFVEPVREPVLKGLAEALGTLENLALGLTPWRTMSSPTWAKPPRAA